MSLFMNKSEEYENSDRIVSNLNRIEWNIVSSCEASGRKRKAVTLVAVSKNQPEESIMAAYNWGVRAFGENRVHELVHKIDSLPKDIEWHMIGNLQTNKVKFIVGKVRLIHSVNSLRLADEINFVARNLRIFQDILIEVNIAEEETKHGIPSDKTEDLIKQIINLDGLRVRGLMAMAPYTEDGENNRQYFKKLRELYIDIARKNIDNTNNVKCYFFDTLSMGMTGDYTVAIEEGANLIRVGTGVFGAD